MPNDKHDTVRMKANLRQRCHEQVGPCQTPCHLPHFPGGYSGNEKCRSRAIDCTRASARELMQRPIGKSPAR